AAAVGGTRPRWEAAAAKARQRRLSASTAADDNKTVTVAVEGQGTIPTATNDAFNIYDDNGKDDETDEDEPNAKRNRGGGSKVEKLKKNKNI
ncbi:hypothetical protein E2562_025486, partial [Oryza meyeriana var. granulata]